MKKYSKGKHSKSSSQRKIKSKQISKKNKIFFSLLQIIAICLIAYSGYNIYEWYNCNNMIEEETEEIADIIEVEEIKDSDDTIIVDSGTDADSSDPYWDYIDINLIDVDFSELEEINSDVVAWLQVNGTNINYPVVQTTDNSYYLKHSFYKNYNKAGWVFMDYRNNSTSFDKNTIIYAHSRLNQTMFGSLQNLLSSDWYSDTSNYIIKFATKTQTSLWQIFSVYHLPVTSDYLQVSFSSDDEFISFANMLQERSVYEFNTTIDENDKIITLSTCYQNNSSQRMVMHAKLIKYTNK